MKFGLFVDFYDLRPGNGMDLFLKKIRQVKNCIRKLIWKLRKQANNLYGAKINR